MKKNYLIRWFTIILFIGFSVISCRNEITTQDEKELTKSFGRNEKFFINTENSQLNKGISVNDFIIKLKKHNRKQNFISKLSDKKGLPLWKYAFSNQNKETIRKGENGEDFVVVPLSEENSHYLTSVLYIKNIDSENPEIFTITNEQLQSFVNNTSIPKIDRETVLMTFLYFDNKVFGEREYNSIPTELFEGVHLEDNGSHKSFRIHLNQSSTTSREAEACFTFYHCKNNVDENVCDQCTQCVSRQCYPLGGGTDDGGSGEPWTNPGDGTGTNTGGSTGNPGNPDLPWYLQNPNVDISSYPTNVQNIFELMVNHGIILQQEHLNYLRDTLGLATKFRSYLFQNNNQQGANIAFWALSFIYDNQDTIQPNKILERIQTLDAALDENPDMLLNIPCDQLPHWNDVANYQIPQSVKNKINNIPNQNSYWSSWNITDIESGAGARINMDLFPVRITTFPKKPNSNERYSASEFFEFFRKNINLFAEKFTPIENNHYNIHDTALWNSSNPLGALIHIDITPDDGTVVCSGYSTNTWVFTTMKAPQGWSYDGIHPVAGNRKFSMYTNPNDGSYTIYTRGVDRTSRNNDDNTPIINAIMESTAFVGADRLWSSMQEKLETYINSHEGSSSKVQPEKYRPNYNKVKAYLKNQVPLSALGCN